VDPSELPAKEQAGVGTGAEALLVLITTGSQEEAEKIARKLVEERLAACVNIVPQVRSLFWWENKVSEEEEVLLIVKTRRSRFGALVLRVKALHSYQVPEIIALPIVEGSLSYLQWIDKSTSG
jgi:periplasmic divalent cation tolerance protein